MSRSLRTCALLMLAVCSLRLMADDTWSFNPPQDKYAADCLLDLRSMNEQVAGEHGLIALSPDGMSFSRGDGQPIRFWAANAAGQNSTEAIEDQIRFLAKKGVNMIRLHRSS